MMIENRDIRQRDLVPANLAEMEATVVGVGAIGRQVAIQLAAIGIGKLILVDFDTVDPENLAPQGFLEKDLGSPKVEAVAKLCKEINSEIKIVPVNNKFHHTFASRILFCCVDSISTRERIFNQTIDKIQMFIDGRMSAECLRVLIADDAKSQEHYKTTLFAQNEAFRGSCTSKSTVYCANIAAGLMVSKMMTSLRGCDISKDISLNLTTDDFIIMD